METLAALSSGLGTNSRISQKINHIPVPLDTLLLARIVDGLNILIWQRTENGSKGRNRPKSLVDELMHTGESEIEGFNSAEEFEAAMRQFEES